MIRRLHWWRQAALVVSTVGVMTILPTVVVQAFPPSLGLLNRPELGRGLAEAQGAEADRPAVAGTPLQTPPARQSVWDGVYTDDQARRGEAHYARSCESCHGADLAGNPVDEIPALAWDAFLLHWNDRTIKDLFDSIKRSMPQDKPGSLNARAYVDVIAYILQMNKFPAGGKELGLNADVLGQIVIERTKR